MVLLNRLSLQWNDDKRQQQKNFKMVTNQKYAQAKARANNTVQLYCIVMGRVLTSFPIVPFSKILLNWYLKSNLRYSFGNTGNPMK